jgi:hypothetical protein
MRSPPSQQEETGAGCYFRWFGAKTRRRLIQSHPGGSRAAACASAKNNPTITQSVAAAAAAVVSSVSAPALPSARSAHGLVAPASTATGGSSWREGDLVFHPEHLKGTLVEIEHGNARGKPYRVVFNGSLDEHWYIDASMD